MYSFFCAEISMRHPSGARVPESVKQKPEKNAQENWNFYFGAKEGTGIEIVMRGVSLILDYQFNSEEHKMHWRYQGE